MPLRVCKRCLKAKPYTEFYWNTNHGKVDLRPECSACTKKRSTRANNAEANAAYMREYRRRKKEQ